MPPQRIHWLQGCGEIHRFIQMILLHVLSKHNSFFLLLFSLCLVFFIFIFSLANLLVLLLIMQVEYDL